MPLPQLADDRRGEHLGHVVALGGQRVVGAHELRHGRLGQALGPAAAAQVRPLDAVVADAVVDLGARLEHDPDLLAPAGPGLPGADAELGLLAAQRVLADAADLLGEAADALEDLTPERHVAAHEVAHLGPLGGLAGVGAADDPVELAGGVAVGRVRAGEHVRAAAAVGPGRPARVGHAADGLHGDVLVGLEQRGEPAGAGAGVVVEEDHDVALGLGDGGVAGAGQALDVRVGQHPHVGELGLRALQEGRVVVDDDQRLDRRDVLRRDGLDRRHDVGPPLLGVDADDDGGGGHVISGASGCGLDDALRSEYGARARRRRRSGGWSRRTCAAARRTAPP